jgi:predicted MFS family arabinose efflux permease
MAALAIGSLALVILGIDPILLGSMIVEGRLGQFALGWLVAVEIVAIALGSMIGLSLLARWSAPGVVVSAGLIAIVADLLTIGRGGTVWLIGMRGAAGLGEGVMLAIASVVIARSERPARLAAVFLAVQTLLQLCVATALPHVRVGGSQADTGTAALALAAALAVLTAWALPPRLEPAPKVARRGAPSVRSLGGLLAAAFYMGGIVTLWSYLGVWLAQNGHAISIAGPVVALSLACQILGALAAARYADGLSTRWLIGLVSLAEIAVVALMIFAGGSILVVYLIGAVFGFLWLFTLPAFTSLQIDTDPARRGVLYVGAAQLGGAALTPVAASAAERLGGIQAVWWIAVALFATTAILVFVVSGTRQGSAGRSQASD